MNINQDTYADEIRKGNRRALSKAITLVESTQETHRKQARALFEALLPSSNTSLRLGISGSPGVGKSSFINTFGRYLLDQGHKVAVLAIDPSSPRSGGAILADKTRMGDLSGHPNCFVRPSPSTGAPGIHPATLDTITLCEAAGFDWILIETVGVGQSEFSIADVADMVCVLIHPAAGDELQGFKRGLLELAHMLIVTKADGDLKDLAEQTRVAYADTLKLLPSPAPYWKRRIKTCSAHKKVGLEEIYQIMQTYKNTLEEGTRLEEIRNTQRLASFQTALQREMEDLLRSSPKKATFEILLPSLKN